MAEKGYARPELLVDTEWLAAHMEDSGLRLVDAGAPVSGDPRAERIAGSVSPPHPYIKGAEGSKHVAPAADAKAIFDAMGIGTGTQVVVYDSARSVNAARFWWVLSYYGHADVRILDGGFDKWVAEGRPVVTDVADPAPASFSPKANPAVLSTVDTLRAAIDDAGAAIWDTRSLGEYTGETDRGNARAGHVPGAAHLEWSDLMASDATFKPAAEMSAALGAIGITPDKAVHTY